MTQPYNVVPDSTLPLRSFSFSQMDEATTPIESLSSPTPGRPSMSPDDEPSPATRPKPRWASKVTYGKRKSEVEVEVQPELVSPLNTSLSLSVLDDDDDNASSTSASPFKFSWQRDLEALDNEPDEPMSTQVSASVQIDTPTEVLQISPSKPATLSKPLKNLFGTSSLSSLSSTTSSSPSRPIKARTQTRRAVTTLESATESEIDDEGPQSKLGSSHPHRPIKRRVVEDSDADSDSALVPLNSTTPSASGSHHSSPAKLVLTERALLEDTQGELNDATGPENDADQVPARRKARTRASKVKRPTKKEIKASVQESAKLHAERRFEVPEVEEQPRMKLTGLFGNILPGKRPTRQPVSPITSDPIESSSQEFLSSVQPTALDREASLSADVSFEDPGFSRSMETAASNTPVKTPGREHTLSASKLSFDFGNDGLLGSSPAKISPAKDRGLHPKLSPNQKTQTLAQLKLEILKKAAAEKLQRTSAPAPVDDEHEEDILILHEAMPDSQQESLLIVEKTSGRSKTTKRLADSVLHDKMLREQGKSPAKMSVGSKHNMMFARATRRSKPGQDLPKPLSLRIPDKAKDLSRPGALAELVQKSKHKQNTLRKRKDAEWTGHGGSSRRHNGREASSAGGEAIQQWLQKGSETAAAHSEDHDDDEDPEDGDWDDEENERGSEVEDVDEDGGVDKENEPPLPLPRMRGSISSSEGISGNSDGENVDDKENLPPTLQSQADHDIFSPSHSRQPSTGSSGGGTDKENEFDQENIPPAFSTRRFDSSDEEDDTAASLTRVRRRPLRTMVIDDDEEDDDKESMLVLGNSPRHGALAFDTLSDDNKEQGSRPTSLFQRRTLGKALFTDNDICGANEESFSLDHADAQGDGDGFTQLFAIAEKPKAFGGLRSAISLSNAALESQGLLPPMAISTNDRIRDDAIFGEDQEARALLVRGDTHVEVVQDDGSSHFINEEGFLTQTGPANGKRLTRSPLALLSTNGFSQAVLVQDDSATDMNTIEDILVTEPRRRLVKGVVGSKSLSTQQESAPKNAFQILQAAAAKVHHRDVKQKDKLEKSAFVEGEAQESDEEDIFGFNGNKADEDEEEEGDKPVEGLVDDAFMDVETENVDKVLEKVQEQAAEDDAALERLHQAAAQGELRSKKRDRGIGLNGSDSEDSGDEEENRRLRRTLAKKRKLRGGDGLEALDGREETRPFYHAYKVTLANDADDDLVLPSSDGPELQELEDMAEGDSDEENQPPSSDDQENHAPSGDDEEPEIDSQPTITIAEAHRQLRQAIAEKRQFIDPEDTSWLPTEPFAHADTDEIEDYQDAMAVNEILSQGSSKKIVPKVKPKPSKLGRFNPRSRTSGLNRISKEESQGKASVSGLGRSASVSQRTGATGDDASENSILKPAAVLSRVATKLDGFQ